MASRIAKNVLSNVAKIATEVVEKFPKIPNVWGYASFPDHSNKRCVDYMVPDKETGDAVARYHIENAKQFGVHGIIWNRKVMGFPHVTNPPYRGPYGEWRTYSGPKPHTDHVHVEYDGKGKPNPKSITMFATKFVKGYDVNGVGKVKFTRKRGFKVIGKIVSRSDGKYLLTRFGTLYPFDSLSDKKPVL